MRLQKVQDALNKKNIKFAAGRSEDIDGDYEEKISAEILSWPDMINN